MFINDPEISKRINSFTKYAQFISGRFGVSVVFDGTGAKTDGKVITLPNIAGLTERETDFLYCVLLHEVGHIKFSTFSKEAFKKIKSQAHFILCNAIEDARIENLIMQEFDGANDIFEDLYNDFVVDRDFVKRIFGFDPVDVDLFKAVVTYIHYSIINLKHKIPFPEVVGKNNDKAVAAFVKKHDLDRIIGKAAVKSWDDVVKLANKIYDIFFDTKKDSSEKYVLKGIDTAVCEAKACIEGVKKKFDSYSEEIEEITSEIKERQEKIQAVLDENKDEIAKIKQSSAALQKDIQQVEDLQSAHDTISANSEDIISVEGRLFRKEDTVNSLKARLDKLSQKAEKAPEDLEKLNDVENRLKKAQSLVDRYNKRLDAMKKENAELYPKLQGIRGEAANNEISIEEQLNRHLSDLKEKLGKHEDRLREIDEKIASDVQKVKDLEQKREDKKVQAAKRLIKDLVDTQDQLRDDGIPVEFIPTLEPTPGWEESDDAQKAFDSEASGEEGTIVSCGMDMGSYRDILAMVDYASNGLEQIDVSKLFMKKSNVSMIDHLNESSAIRNTLEIKAEDGPFSSPRNHIPATTAFDSVKVQTYSAGEELATIRQANAPHFKALKEVLVRKLRFKKKDFFRGSQEEGLLDKRAIWKLAAKNGEDYFEINRPKPENNVAGTIAIDISGSMDKKMSEGGKRVKEVALMLSDALKECHVRHEVLGYHAPVNHEMRKAAHSTLFNRTSNNLETVIYKNFADKNNSGIQNIELQCSDNSDGESLLIAGKRLLKERGKRKILFVVTDGKPFLTEADVSVLDQDLKNAIDWLTRKKIEIYAIGFNEEPKGFYKDNYCKVATYRDLVDFCNRRVPG